MIYIKFPNLAVISPGQEEGFQEPIGPDAAQETVGG